MVKKKVKPPKSSAKKKLTKAQKEALKKEEEERKLQEEEEARLKAEQDALEKQEQDKLEAEQRKIQEKEENSRRRVQLTELNTVLDGHRSILDNQANERRKTAKWNRYMRCDGTPDPTIPGEINTYINLWRDDKSNDDIVNVLTNGKTVLDLINELSFLMEDSPEGDLTPTEIALYNQTISNLQQLLAEKLDRASQIVLLEATERSDPETMNLQRVEKNEFVTLCFWGNLSKNPRIKSYEFKEVKVQFEIPKLLTLTDCAYRVMVTQYDHLSYKCKSYYPRQKAKEEEEQPEGEASEETEKKDEEKVEGEEGDENTEEQPQLEEEKTEDLMAMLHKKDDEEEDKPAEPEPEPEPEPDPIPDDEEQAPEPEEWEDFDGDEDAVDLRSYSPVGGVMYLHLLHLPPQPKNVRNWVITQLPDKDNLAYMTYLCDDNNLELIQQKQKEAEDDEKGVKVNKDEEKKRDERPPIGITMTMPDNVHFCEEPQVARWDEEGLTWRLDGFSQPTYDEATRLLKFNTSYFGPLTLLQDTHINMPFQSWELRPRGQNAAVLSIIAAIVEVEIEIKDGQCQLSKPENTELSHLRDTWYNVKDFIKAMKAAGVNLFPNKDSSKYVSIQEKDPIAERRLYEQMALTASGMAYSWSKWNNEAGNDKIVVQAAESLKDEPLGDDQWALFMITRKRSNKLRVTEFDEEFSEDPAEETKFHADMYHMAEEIMSLKGMAQVRDSNYHFFNAVLTMLQATRLFVYS